MSDSEEARLFCVESRLVCCGLQSFMLQLILIEFSKRGILYLDIYFFIAQAYINVWPQSMVILTYESCVSPFCEFKL